MLADVAKAQNTCDSWWKWGRALRGEEVAARQTGQGRICVHSFPNLTSASHIMSVTYVCAHFLEITVIKMLLVICS
jgi:hypothetical protein